MSQAITNLSDRELLVRLYERVDIFIVETKEFRAEQQKQIDELQARPCPRAICSEHEMRISKLEDHEKIIVGVVSLAVLGSGVLVWLLDKMLSG